MIMAQIKRKLVVAILEITLKTPPGIIKFKTAAMAITPAEIITASAGTEFRDNLLTNLIPGRCDVDVNSASIRPVV